MVVKMDGQGTSVKHVCIDFLSFFLHLVDNPVDKRDRLLESYNQGFITHILYIFVFY